MLGWEHYIILAATTLLVALLTGLIWRRTKSPVFALGAFLVYYWTLFGAWTLVHDLSIGKTQTRYQYLFSKMFRVELDADYFGALIYYCCFVLVILVVVYAVVPRRPHQTSQERAVAVVTVSHLRLAFSSVVAVALSFFFVKDQLAEAIFLDVSG